MIWSDRVRCLLAAAALLVLPALPLHAQAPADSALTRLLHEGTARRWIVRASVDSTVLRQGVLTGYTDSTLSIADEHLRLAEITMLERRMSSRRSLRTGAIVGGLIGAAVGALGAAFACEMDESSDPCTGMTIKVVAFTAGIGAGMGGLSAGFLGRSEWRQVWQRW